MNSRVPRAASLFLATFGYATLVEATYVAPRFHDLAGLSDLVVLGEIVSLTPTTFTLRVQEALVGHTETEELVVVQFKDWTCSHRWKPYKPGQVELAFLRRLPTQPPAAKPPWYYLPSAGDEAEWEIEGDRVSVQGFRVPGGTVFDQGEHPGQWLPLADVLDAVRGYRHCFSVSPPPEGKWASSVRLACDPSEVEAYRQRSSVHEYLAKTSLEAQERAAQQSDAPDERALGSKPPARR